MNRQGVAEETGFEMTTRRGQEASVTENCQTEGDRPTVPGLAPYRHAARRWLS